jgi:two-component system LytT family response regulator
VEILKILIADDEALARRRIVRLLEALEGVEVVAQCCDGKEVLRELGADLEVDVLMLDIRMPGLTGIETAALMPEDAPHVIFTTAHQEHAVEAFDVGAADYLLKPVEAARLALAVERARERLMGAQSQPRLAGRLPVHTRAGIVLVDPHDITHASFDGELVTLHTERGELLCDYTLAHLEERLASGPFVRVHRRALLNLEKVRRLEPQQSGGYIARVPGGAPVPVSRQAARRLRRHLGL